MEKMHPHSNPSQFSKVFKERVRTLLEDRYCLRFKATTPTLWYVRLKHMANGNDITIKGYPKTGQLEQWTNRVLTYRQTFPPRAASTSIG